MNLSWTKCDKLHFNWCQHICSPLTANMNQPWPQSSLTTKRQDKYIFPLLACLLMTIMKLFYGQQCESFAWIMGNVLCKYYLIKPNESILVLINWYRFLSISIIFWKIFTAYFTPIFCWKDTVVITKGLKYIRNGWRLNTQSCWNWETDELSPSCARQLLFLSQRRISAYKTKEPR